MARWNDWQRITDYLKLMINKSNYAPYVNSLLTAIPFIDGQDGFEDVHPGLTHLTLTMSIPGARSKVHVDYARPGLYNVYLDGMGSEGATQQYGEWRIVPLEELVDIIRGYMVRLRVEGLEAHV
jgi:hypothetical protein